MAPGMNTVADGEDVMDTTGVVDIVEMGDGGQPGWREPMFVDDPGTTSATHGTWAVLVHAPGENRTGNNYWLVQAARGLAAAGVPSVRFDLSGHGESLGPKDAARWLEQIGEAVALAAERGAGRVLLAARGLYCSLLNEVASESDIDITRVALFPPPEDALSWWNDTHATGGVVEADPTGPQAAAFWTACGAEPNLVGGCVYPLALLDRLMRRTETAEGQWDHAVTTTSWSRDTAAVRAVINDDPLTRHADERTALVDVLVRLATETPETPVTPETPEGVA
jgi:pimeloyl-ACP methyl ester carboxylesterase